MNATTGAISSIKCKLFGRKAVTTVMKQTEELSHTLAQIKADVLAVVGGLIGGAGLFAMTVWLVLKDGPHAGQHLQLLSNYFIGYSVTWGGAFVGLLYGAITGGAIGWLIGRIYNAVVDARKK
ncbi:MAG: hypothetical protein LZF86_110760 [Nitrospira sp.]|nr:MAG: hypothetical protein LZF86_110760 [Nitrospira sp.]